MATQVTAKRYSADFFSLIEGDKVMGFAMQLTNGKWCMMDTNDRRMDYIAYDSPAQIAKCFQDRPFVD